MEVSTGGLPGLTMRGWDQIEGFLNRLGPAANTLNGASEQAICRMIIVITCRWLASFCSAYGTYMARLGAHARQTREVHSRLRVPRPLEHPSVTGPEGDDVSRTYEVGGTTRSRGIASTAPRRRRRASTRRDHRPSSRREPSGRCRAACRRPRSARSRSRTRRRPARRPHAGATGPSRRRAPRHRTSTWRR